jgi:GNAT superfamily N-acetyltransferase
MIRPARISDLDQITHVRTNVIENHLSVEQLAAVGITQKSIAAGMTSGDLGAWVAEFETRVVAFAMTDRRDGSIFALFVLPEFEGRGMGTALLEACETDLRKHGFASAKLGTGPETRAYTFYIKCGWQPSSAISGTFAADVVLTKKL